MQDQSCIFRQFALVSFILKTISSLTGNKVEFSKDLFLKFHALHNILKNV